MKKLDSYQRLVARLKLFPDRNWLELYFDYVNELMAYTGLSSDDPRLVMSLPVAKNLPVTINNRYVCEIFIGKTPTVGFLLGADVAQAPEIRLKSIDKYLFDPRSGQALLGAPVLLYFRDIPVVDFLKEEWKQASLFELNCQKKSQYKAYHEPLLYEVAVNPLYRNSILNEVFAN